VEEHSYYSQVSQTEERYSIYLPPCYGQRDSRYPVVYLLHGWPFGNEHWIELGATETAEEGIGAGILPPFIIVMPRGGEWLYVNTSGGDVSFDAQVVKDLIPHIDEVYRTIATREGRSIGGISRGGVWSLEIGMMHPDMFSAVGAHSPALAVNLAPPPYDPFYLLSRPEVAALRFYLDSGDTDWTRSSTQSLQQALENQGIISSYAQHTGAHNDELWAQNVTEYLMFYSADWFHFDVEYELD
jgi:enterochelin esterase-like enzyme